LTDQTISGKLASMLDSRIRRLLDAYPAIFLACHRRHVREDESGRALTEHQASILDHLHPIRPTSLSRLAEHMGVGRSTMSITVARLVRGGYIVRRRDKNDRRSACLMLSATGVRIKEQNTLLDPDLVTELFGFMAAAEMETALRGVERLAEAARALLRRRSRGKG
jgi:MarR family transcriptional regulator, organic hydroperoxide resistance regulator